MKRKDEKKRKDQEKGFLSMSQKMKQANLIRKKKKKKKIQIEDVPLSKCEDFVELTESQIKEKSEVFDEPTGEYYLDNPTLEMPVSMLIELLVESRDEES